MKKKKYAWYFTLMGLFSCASVLLLMAIVNSQELDDSHFLQTETVYVILTLAVLFLVAVWVMTALVLKRKKIYKLGDLTLGNDKKDGKENADKPKEAEAKDEAAEKIDKDVATRERFYMLNKTDAQMAKQKAVKFDENVTLKSICEDFRNFSASKLGLYYSIDDIRRFIASLAVTHIIVMQGMSGTGKTSLAFAFGEFLGNKSTIIPIQPMWKERTDLIGYYNEFTKRFNETELLQKMYEANYSDKIYITVLDEMNIARVEYYFAEFLSLLEIPNPESRYLDVVTDEWDNDPKMLKNGRIKLPENMWFIGTANNDDSTFAISDKVYDRAMVMNLDRKAKRFDAKETKGVNLSYKTFIELSEVAKTEFRISERSLKMIAKLDEYMMQNLQVTFGNRIMKQLREYVGVYIACGGEETEAIDDIMVKKVLRKLEAKNPVLVRNSAEGLREAMDDIFGVNKLPLCKQYLTILERNS